VLTAALDEPYRQQIMRARTAARRGSSSVTHAVDFTCPAMRGNQETGGAYSLHVSTLVDEDPVQTVTCQ
jgi:hypothetical protein